MGTGRTCLAHSRAWAGSWPLSPRGALLGLRTQQNQSRAQQPVHASRVRILPFNCLTVWPLAGRSTLWPPFLQQQDRNNRRTVTYPRVAYSVLATRYFYYPGASCSPGHHSFLAGRAGQFQEACAGEEAPLWKLPQVPGLEEVAESCPHPSYPEDFLLKWGLGHQSHMHVLRHP